MKEYTIVIAGPIGDFTIDSKEVIGVSLLDIVGSVNQAPADTKVLRVQISSPGGVKQVGDQIYNYLNSLKSKYKIVTEQVGMIASIATKLFGVGVEREATTGQSFMIHNPWTVVKGDAKVVEAVALELKAVEAELKQFYITLTGITEEGIAPLLNAETTFTAEQALELKFATKINSPLKIVSFMKTEDTAKVGSLLDQLLAIFKTEQKPLALAVELESGSSLQIAAADISKLEGATVFSDVASQVPATDGDYKLKDGRTITVAAGKVTVVKAGVIAPVISETALVLKLDSLIALIAKDKADVLSAIDTKIVALKAEIKTTHKPMGFKVGDKVADIATYDKLFKENKMLAFKRENPEGYAKLHFAKWGKLPN